MRDTPTDELIALGQPTPDDEPIDVDQMVRDLGAVAQDQRPIAAGTFVLYPLPDGGIHLVAQIDHAAAELGVPLGEMRRTIPAGLIRMFATWANSGSRLSGLLGRLRGGR